MPNKFDASAAIMGLAEAEWECPCFGLGFDNGGPCPEGCDGTGRIVPFAALRLTCDSEECGVGFDDINDCVICMGRGWFPEPDVEKAEARIVRYALSTGTYGWDLFTEFALSFSAETYPILRAALVWVKEQHEPSN